MDYLKYYAATLVLGIGFVGFVLGGDWVWLGAATFVVITTLDFLLPRDYNVRKMKPGLWAAITVWLGGLGPIAIFLAFAWRMGVEDLTALQVVGGTLSCMWLALMPGIAAQHVDHVLHAKRLAHPVDAAQYFARGLGPIKTLRGIQADITIAAILA